VQDMEEGYVGFIILPGCEGSIIEVVARLIDGSVVQAGKERSMPYWS
jgi:hypothetical protein